MMHPTFDTRLAPLLMFALLGVVLPAQAQTVVTGTVVDAEDGLPLRDVNVVATRLGPGSTRAGGVTDATGVFRLRLADADYRLHVSFVGYKPVDRTFTVAGRPVDLGQVVLVPDTLALDETVVEAVQERVLLRGDTTVYNADAFKVNPNASAEDLVAKMPGMVVQDGTVQAQGEEVRRVLVDGEEFFGNDPTAALRNLPAEIVQEIEVYDRQSDQARFTGFDDGNAEKTLNVVTRPGMQDGRFGNVYGGYGTDARYRAGGTLNVFADQRRLSVIGIANNVNQQNFSMEDLLGVLGAAGNRRSGPPGGGGGRMISIQRPSGGGGPSPGAGGPPPGGGASPNIVVRGGGPGGLAADPGNYLVGAQDGLTTTSALGLNYIDRWGSRVRVNGSYFFNLTGNTTDANLEREYITGDANQRYTEANDAESDNMNHRLSFRLEAALSDATELTITPRLSVQSNTAESLLSGFSERASGTPLSQTSNAYTADNIGYTSATNVLLRHRFATRGRTLSANVGLGLDGRRGDTDQDVQNLFYDAATLAVDSTDAYSRQIDSDGWGRTFSANIAYTEPLGGSSLLQVNYMPSVAHSASDQDAFRLDAATETYSILDSTFTSQGDRQVVTQRGGVSYQYQGERFSASAGLDLQEERLSYEQAGPRAFAVDRSYRSLLPSANLRFTLSQAVNLDLDYRPSTSVPSVNQLRDVIDNTNPLFITSGNPELQTSFSHRLDLRLRALRPDRGQVFFGFVNLTTTRDYIGTATVMASADTLLAQGITLEPGAQFSYPVNLDGYWSARSFFTYGRPVGLLRSNANVSLGLAYSRTPDLINDRLTRSDAVQLDGRLFLGSNISERIDASFSYGLSYTTVTNASAWSQDGDYLRHRGSFRLTWLPWGGFVVESEVNLSAYAGLSASVDPTVLLWNGGVGYTFLQDDLAEIRLSVTDLLDQNASVNRTVTGLYVEDSETQALGRYVMLTLTYKLRHFNL